MATGWSRCPICSCSSAGSKAKSRRSSPLAAPQSLAPPNEQSAHQQPDPHVEQSFCSHEVIQLECRAQQGGCESEDQQGRSNARGTFHGPKLRLQNFIGSARISPGGPSAWSTGTGSHEMRGILPGQSRWRSGRGSRARSGQNPCARARRRFQAVRCLRQFFGGRRLRRPGQLPARCDAESAATPSDCPVAPEMRALPRCAIAPSRRANASPMAGT